MRNRYIALMSEVFSAYSDEAIAGYFDSVKKKGLTEHGFPRLVANLGVLISNRIRTDLLPLFCEMMDFCCENIPRVKAANDFSVREIITCIEALEQAGSVDRERLSRCKMCLAGIEPQECYTVFATSPDDMPNNWACFTAVSEFMRQRLGLYDSAEFTELQISSQLLRFDGNGMYRDPNCPMVYDLVVRGLFSFLLTYGYNGIYRNRIDSCLRSAGLSTLVMQSVTGEIPFGGRSNQFLFNEALNAIVFEYEANRYFLEGNTVLSARFKSAAEKSLENIGKRLSAKPISHIKNRYPIESRYGCEKYAYFDKYMVTTASYLYMACLICNDEIKATEQIKPETEVFRTSEDFHKVFLKCEPYSLEFDTSADPHYDVSGLGRLHCVGAPSAICLSLPCTEHPEYSVDVEQPAALSIAVGVRHCGEWQLATDSGVEYRLTDLSKTESSAAVGFICKFPCGESVASDYTVDASGVNIGIEGDGEVSCLLPAFDFDGETRTEIECSDGTLTVAYGGWRCRCTSNGEIIPFDGLAVNRNGHYRRYLAVKKSPLKINIIIEKIPGKPD